MEAQEAHPTLFLPDELRAESSEDIAYKAWEVVTHYLEAAGGPAHSKVHLLPKQWRFVFVMQYIDGQVNNGGFHQLFTNGAGEFDGHMREDTELIAHPEYAAVFRSALDEYDQLDYREQWDNLGKSWDRFVEGYKQESFGADDTKYFKIVPELPVLIGDYIREHFDSYSTVDEANPFDLQPKQPRGPIEHPFLRRLSWSPYFAAIPFSYAWYSSFTRDFPIPRTLWACFTTLWLLLAILDFRTGHAFLDSLYSEDDEGE